jgi:Kef-type K+ transport system membrane component KefB
MHELLKDIALCIIAAWALGVLAHFLRQPVLIAYLAGGFALGPHGLKLIQTPESIETISELGLIFLLFMIGLEIDLKKVISAGRSILVTAASQIIAGCVLGVAFFRLLGFPLTSGKWDALYLGVAAALSSTVIIVKVLYDKRELDTLPGRITLGVLVLQDLFVILFLAVQPSLDNLQASAVLLSAGRVCVLVASALAFSRFVLPPLFHSVARLPELVLVGAISWCFLVGELAAQLHLSREMGALIAGVSLSTFPYALDVTAKITSLRDFFVTLFFVGLGMTIPLPTAPLLIWALIFAAFVVASRFVTTFTPIYAMRLGLRASLVPAINLSQVSEFSLVVMTLGLSAKHIGPETAGPVSFAFVLLALLSTFGMAKSDALVRFTLPLLKRGGFCDLDAIAPAAGAVDGHGNGARILILGFFRTASSLLEELKEHQEHLLSEIAVVDFNPTVINGMKKRGMKVIYGDISQRETLHHAGIGTAQVLICTVPDALLKGTNNFRLVRQLREMNANAKIIATADVLAEVPNLYSAGANYVLVPRFQEAADLCQVLEACDCDLLADKRAALDAKLGGREEILP